MAIEVLINMNEVQNKSSVVLKVKIASLLFGLGSWITITGFWAELPLLTDSLPEKWNLSSQLTLFIQAANIGPLIYWICRVYKICSEVTATHIQMVLGVISCFVLIFFWNQTIYIFNGERSLPLMMAAFGLSILDCTSSVTFLPFMGRFKSQHLTPYLIGEGLSGFIPIIVAMIQGAPNETADDDLNGNFTIDESSVNRTKVNNNLMSQVLFGPSIFFTSLFATLLISWISFFYLIYSKTAHKEHVIDNCDEESNVNNNNNNNRTNIDKGISSPSNEGQFSSIKELNEGKIDERSYFILQLILVYSCLTTFGIFPSLQPFSNLPYAKWTLHYTVILTGLAYPAGCFIALFKEIKSIKWITIWTLIATLISVYILIIAIMSPFPPFVNQVKSDILGIDTRTFGGLIIVTCWVLFILILSYVKTVITILLSRAKGEDGLFMVGLLTQVASIFGAGFMFAAVNIFKWFKS